MTDQIIGRPHVYEGQSLQCQVSDNTIILEANSKIEYGPKAKAGTSFNPQTYSSISRT